MKALFSEYILSNNKQGSGKAVSYIRALDLLSQMIKAHPYQFRGCENVWTLTSLERIQELYQFTNTQKKDPHSKWLLPNIAPSYLKDGYCTAALKSYMTFIAEYSFEASIKERFDSYEGDETLAHEALNLQAQKAETIIEQLAEVEGKESIRLTKTRCNQNAFRKIILALYNDSCCVTGLNIPQLNRASHIIPWADDAKIRLDPRNGLCLSATYDIAFDRYLITFDEDYRMLISKDVKEFYSNEVVRKYFSKLEGHKMTTPSTYQPSQKYLKKHRSLVQI